MTDASTDVGGDSVADMSELSPPAEQLQAVLPAAASREYVNSFHAAAAGRAAQLGRGASGSAALSSLRAFQKRKSCGLVPRRVGLTTRQLRFIVGHHVCIQPDVDIPTFVDSGTRDAVFQQHRQEIADWRKRSSAVEGEMEDLLQRDVQAQEEATRMEQEVMRNAALVDSAAQENQQVLAQVRDAEAQLARLEAEGRRLAQEIARRKQLWSSRVVKEGPSDAPLPLDEAAAHLSWVASGLVKMRSLAELPGVDPGVAEVVTRAVAAASGPTFVIQGFHDSYRAAERRTDLASRVTATSNKLLELERLGASAT